VLVDSQTSTLVSDENILYKCEWSPFSGHEFSAQIKHTWVNGDRVYSHSEVFVEQTTQGNERQSIQQTPAMRLSFER
ncbi:dihydroorotase, partial [Vibrio breoganii]